MGFQRFEATGRNYTPQISISKEGYLNFNAGTCRRFHLLERKYTHVILYFNADTRMIGFELTKDEEAPGARKLQLRPPSAGLYIKAFLDFYNIDRSRRRTYEPRWDEATGLLVVGPVPVIKVDMPNATSNAGSNAQDPS